MTEQGRRQRARVMAAGLALGVVACVNTAAIGDQVHSSELHDFHLVVVTDGLSHPWGMAFLPGGDILVTERAGRLRLVRDGKLLDQPLTGVPQVAASGQGGLLDVALHPDFADNRLIYLAYAKPGPQGATTAIARGRLGESGLEEVEDIFVAQAWGTTGRHFGSRLVFDGDGNLYLTIGDRGEMDRAQNPRDHAGTTIRLHDDGSVPEDNPFGGRSDALPEIYTFGNRNAQGMVIHPDTGAVWQNEHGPRGGDEINLIQAGRNYGWPRVTHGVAYSGAEITPHVELEGTEPPLLHWTPSIAPSGMAVYTGDAFPEWQGDVFVGALAGQHLRRVVFDGLEPVHEESLLQGFARIRDVRTGPDGFLYLLTDESSAVLVRLEPAGG
jgi:aldose sugar dehydrogenase